MLNIGVIGYGYWGPNLIRNFASLPDADLVMVCDLSPERLNEVAEQYPGIRVIVISGMG